MTFGMRVSKFCLECFDAYPGIKDDIDRKAALIGTFKCPYP